MSESRQTTDRLRDTLQKIDSITADIADLNRISMSRPLNNIERDLRHRNNKLLDKLNRQIGPMSYEHDEPATEGMLGERSRAFGKVILKAATLYGNRFHNASVYVGRGIFNGLKISGAAEHGISPTEFDT